MHKHSPIDKRALLSGHFLFQQFKPAEIDRILEFAHERREMGNLIGTSRESVNRALAQWQADGLVRLRQNELTLLKSRELAELSKTSF